VPFVNKTLPSAIALTAVESENFPRVRSKNNRKKLFVVVSRRGKRWNKNNKQDLFVPP
jgi:hypothetical protein